MAELHDNAVSKARHLFGLHPVKFLPWLVLLIGLSATYVLQQTAFNNARQIQKENFFHKTTEIVLRVEQRLSNYEQALRGLEGLFASSKYVDKGEFHIYVEKLTLAIHYVGIQSVGFSRIITPEEKNSHVDTVRTEGFPGYAMRPDGEQNIYTSNIYVEPFRGPNDVNFGYDMYTDSVLRSAMDQARDSDTSIISGKVTLLGEVGQQAQTGFIMFVPVYKNGMPYGTMAERRANIIGWIYASFRINALMQGLFEEQANQFDYEIFDGEKVELASLMFDSDNHFVRHLDRSLFHDKRHIEIAGRPWLISVRSLPAYENNIDTEEVTLIRWAGVLVSVLLSVLVFLLANGRARALKLARDMTKKLQKSEARLAMTLSSAELGAWDWDIKTGYVVFNARWAEMRGLKPEEVESNVNFKDKRICPSDFPLFQEKLAANFNGSSEVFKAQYRVCTQSGTWIWVMGRGSVIEWDAEGRPARMVGVDLDITDSKQIEIDLRVAAEELEEAHSHLLQSEKMASIGQLAAGVAHEINNPIGYVYSNLGTLEKYVQDTLVMLEQYEHAESAINDPQVLELLTVAKDKLDIGFLKEDLVALMAESKDGITRVKKIVQNLKDFSHVDGTEEWHGADLHQGLDSTLNIVNNEIKYKAALIKEYGELPEVECLSSQLNQVFMNLLVNAAHAIEERGTITLRTGREREEVWVEVSDTGKGIAPEYLKKIFDPFFTTKPIGQGTGLGLSLSYGIIHKHHGRIEVQSEIGRGTTFRVYLPIRQPSDVLR